MSQTPSATASTGQDAAHSRQFTVRLSSTRRGARLARRLATQQLAAWGWPYDTRASRSAAQLVAELAANAAVHGRLPGRDFRLRLTHSGSTLRIEVTDTRVERRPPAPADLAPPPPDSETGRGLLFVDALADRWGTDDHDTLTKTVWCELVLKS
ncbi:ATP-binding protein [Streptomyces sp. 7N604]|uniref:ATP-binding protein n=1 Tax=Streptomyces sp. 7N604 TaxID=3457415 RepID=UPI003FD37E90